MVSGREARTSSTCIFKAKITVMRTLVNEASLILSIATVTFAFPLHQITIDEKKGMFGVQRVFQLVG
jgi:hypothetical protein